MFLIHGSSSHLGFDGGNEKLLGWPFSPVLEWVNSLIFNEVLFTQYFFVYNHYYYRDKDVSMLTLLVLAQFLVKFLLIDRLFRGAQTPENVITEYGAIERTRCANVPKRTFLTFLVQLQSEKVFYDYIKRSNKWWYRWGWNYFRFYASFAKWFNPWSYFFFTRFVGESLLFGFDL